MRHRTLKIEAGDGGQVSAVLDLPSDAVACYVFAHGAGAGMTHSFMQSVAEGLAARGVATFRFNFPFMEAGRASRPPDRPAVAQAMVRAAVATAAGCVPGLPLLAGGKSFGGRMTSQAQADAPLADVRGLVFFGFPLHPARKPGLERAAHLSEVTLPMLFLQGTRDGLADTALLVPLIGRLGEHALLHQVADGDHSFHVRASSGRDDAQTLAAMLDTVTAWVGDLIG